MGGVLTSLTERSLPEHDRITYFSDKHLMGWLEILCCPTATGCSVRNFDLHDRIGGKAHYFISKRLSYSQYIPRYVVEATGLPRESAVGRLEREEVLFRAKPGEFIKVQLWKITCNSLQWVGRRRMGGVTPGVEQSLRLAIATQAKIGMKRNSHGELVLDRSKEQWAETISTEDPRLTLRLKEELHKDSEHINDLQIFHNGDLVCTAKKQLFAGALSKEFAQPYLGVQFDATPEDHDKPQVVHDKEVPLLLSNLSLQYLLICLAWSESTMSPVQDNTSSFVTAMRASNEEPGSAKSKSLPVDWNVALVRQHFVEQPWMATHCWHEDAQL